MTRANPLIAISDAEDSVSGLYANILRGEGYRVISIADKGRLFSLINALRPDLIMTDVGSSSINGLELLESIKASNRTRAIPVIVTSSLAKYQADAFDLGAEDFLKKPFEISELIEAVKSALTYLASPN